MSKIKEIWCMHHSHLDIGYTHPQPMLMELQGDYIEQAIDLCAKTRDWPEESQFKWTCEAQYPLLKWMEHAESEKISRFKQMVAEKRISIAALPMHTTPCSTQVQLITMMKELDEVRTALGSEIKTAINHDINGQPWPLSQVLLDSGVDFYMTGINIHFGGIPFKRPMAFRWKTPDGRELLSYVGEHYSLFSQFFHTYESDTVKMHEEIEKYAVRLEKQGHDWDFAMLSATNPPLYDNNCPDAGLADLIRRYNEEGHEYKVRFATPEMLRDKLLSMGLERFPQHGGDWTDYWNFGCASAAQATKVNRLALRALESASVLECMTGSGDSRYRAVRREAEQSALIYNEHTWGASQAISDPEDYESQSQVLHKTVTAYRSADLAGYLVGNRMEALAGNPFQADGMEGIVAVNPAGVSQNVGLRIPKEWMNRERQLSAVRAKRFIPYLDRSGPKKYFANEELIECGSVTLPPFGYRVIPFAKLQEYRDLDRAEDLIHMENGILETPYYRVSVNQETGRIEGLFDKGCERELLDTEKGWAFFELIRETVDGRYREESRNAIFPRDVDLCNQSISMWQHDWKAVRTGAARIQSFRLTMEGKRAVLSWRPQLPGMEDIEQQAVFYTDSAVIDLKVRFHKLAEHKPEGIYLAFPLRLSKDWRCSYSTSGTMVELDEEQLGNMCRDYVSVDNGIAVYGEEGCFGLSCPHAPMVQIGDFNFGKELRAVERKENPLLLAWPLNNYWDTNFVSGQSGTMEFAYRFFHTGQYCADGMYGEFVRGENRGLIGAAVRAEEKSGVLLEENREGMITAVYPAREKGIIVVIQNREKEKQEFSFRMSGRENALAWEVDMQEKKGKSVQAEAGWVKMTLGAGELKLVCVE